MLAGSFRLKIIVEKNRGILGDVHITRILRCESWPRHTVSRSGGTCQDNSRERERNEQRGRTSDYHGEGSLDTLEPWRQWKGRPAIAIRPCNCGGLWSGLGKRPDGQDPVVFVFGMENPNHSLRANRIGAILGLPE